MAKSETEITHIQTSLGLFIVASHETGVRAGQVFSQRTAQGENTYYAFCADWYGPGIPAAESRVPEKGGYSSVAELEKAIVNDLGTQMKTGYWGDR